MELRTAAVYVTGASSGIGAAAAIAFARRGSRLALVARREDRLKEVSRLCVEAGGREPAVRVMDLGVPCAGAEGVRWAEKVLGCLDVIVSNAGYGSRGPTWDFPPEDMERIWRVNYQSGYEAIHTALPGMLKRRRGHVIQVSSILGRRAIPNAAAYCVTKFAQVALGESLRHELHGTGVLASVVCPGSTDTEFRSVAPLPSPSSGVRRRWAQSAEQVGDAIVRVAAGGRSREVHLSPVGCLMLWMNRHFPRTTDTLLGIAIRRLRPPPPPAKPAGG